MKETRHVDALFEIREAEEGQPAKIRGLAIPFGRRSLNISPFAGEEVREVIAPNAFSLDERDHKFFWNHDSSFVLGSTRAGTLKLVKREDGVHFELDPPNTSIGRDAVETIRRGDVDQMSFGFIVRKDDIETEADGTILRTVIDAELIEVSAVPFAAYADNTNVAVRDETRARIDALREPAAFDPETDAETLTRDAQLAALERELQIEAVE